MRRRFVIAACLIIVTLIWHVNLRTYLPEGVLLPRYASGARNVEIHKWCIAQGRHEHGRPGARRRFSTTPGETGRFEAKELGDIHILAVTFDAVAARLVELGWRCIS